MDNGVVDFSLRGKTIVITGGAGILGRRILQALTGAGANVAIIDADVDRLASVAVPENAIAIRTDITSQAEVENARQEIEDRFGPVFGLINNAAVKSPNFFEKFETFSQADWTAVMNVNVYGAVVCSQVFGAGMAERQAGSIVNILSIYGVVAPDQRIYEGSFYEGRSINTPAVYATSKAALLGLTNYLSAYWGEKQIRVNAISPGGISSGQNETFTARYSARVPMGRMAKDTEMSGAVIYLLSDAAAYVTGQNLVIDGGLSVW